MTVLQISEAWFVSNGRKLVAGPFVYNAEAWRWIDRYRTEGDFMQRIAAEESDPMIPRCGVNDRAAVDARQIVLIIRNEWQEALARMLPQIEEVLRETYPEIP